VAALKETLYTPPPGLRELANVDADTGWRHNDSLTITAEPLNRLTSTNSTLRHARVNTLTVSAHPQTDPIYIYIP